ncbi:MAG TPA: porin family protein [Flavobacterium sp.]|jgi:hypothetical protein
MKSIRTITAGMFALFGVASMSAQAEADNTADKSISFGVKAGVNFASFTSTSDGFTDKKPRVGIHAGVVGEFPLSDMVSLQAEAMYSQQGYKLASEGVLSDDAVEYQLDYINVPVLAKFYLVEGLAIEVGPQFSFKINEEIDNDSFEDEGDSDRDAINDFDFGMGAGLSFQTNMGLFFSGRYNRGFTDLVDGQNFQNQVIQISAGYKF